MAQAELHPVFANILAAHMPPASRPTEADLERLNDAHQSLLRLGSFESADPRAYIRATNVLVDHCVRCGMSPDEPDHEAWAAERVARWLLEV